MEKKFGPEFLDLIPALSNVAQSCQALNKFSDAEPLLKRAISIREKNQGSEHVDIAPTREARRALCSAAEVARGREDLSEIHRDPRERVRSQSLQSGSTPRISSGSVQGTGKVR